MAHETPNGRPRVYTGQQDALPTVTARMSYWHVRAARKLGAGNVSEGVRTAIEIAARQMPADNTLAQPVRRNRK